MYWVGIAKLQLINEKKKKPMHCKHDSMNSK